MDPIPIQPHVKRAAPYPNQSLAHKIPTSPRWLTPSKTEEKKKKKKKNTWQEKSNQATWERTRT
jgi:hypothetical protein